MPVEIRELIIKATVGPSGGSAGGNGGSGSDNNAAPGDELVNACVEKILEILRDKHER